MKAPASLNDVRRTEIQAKTASQSYVKRRVDFLVIPTALAFIRESLRTGTELTLD
jgi:hypothetical protein